MTDRVESIQIDLDELVSLRQRVTELEDLLLEKVNLNSELADHLGDVEVEFAALKDLTINQVMEELVALKAGQGKPIGYFCDVNSLTPEKGLRIEQVVEAAKDDPDVFPLYTTRHEPVPLSEWQPIDTAPKDGTVIDLWHGAYGRVSDAWWDVDDGVWVPLGEATGFTHWAPIPPAPV